MERKFALIGTAPSCEMSPVADPSWEFIGVNGCLREAVYPRIDTWYQIHRLEGEPGFSFAGDSPSWKTLIENAMKSRLERWKLCHDPKDGDPGEPPTWVTSSPDHRPEMIMFWPESIEGATRYPVKDIARRYGTYFMTSTFSWVLADLIHKLRDTARENEYVIGLWGIDMEFGTEYFDQRDGMRHFMELAKDVGIEVVVPVTSGLACEPVAYPFWEGQPRIRKLMRHQEFETERKTLAERAMRASETAMLGVDFALKLVGEDKKEGLLARKATFAKQRQEAHETLIAADAVLKHITWHLNFERYAMTAGGTLG